ncbi:MAG: CorA family divalent cation transporter [Patescibacteria group bacterium]
MKHLYEIQHDGLLWVNITKPEEKVLRIAQKRFKFDDQDILESLPPFQRPKIVKKPEYYFMVLHFPVFDRVSKRLSFTEVDFFLSANHLITVHESKLPVIDKFFTDCQKNLATRGQFFKGTAVNLLFELLSRLLDAIFPILLHVNDDINSVDKKLFARMPDRAMAEEILRLKTNIVTFRRTMQGHRTVLERLIMYSGRELDLVSCQGYINSLREFTNEIWHMLDSQQESINALHEANESLVGLRMNETMRTLTIISVITFPLTLLATLFGVKAKGTPFIDDQWGFWMIFGLIALGALLLILIFRRKRWL